MSKGKKSSNDGKCYEASRGDRLNRLGKAIAMHPERTSIEALRRAIERALSVEG